MYTQIYNETRILSQKCYYKLQVTTTNKTVPCCFLLLFMLKALIFVLKNATSN